PRWSVAGVCKINVFVHAGVLINGHAWKCAVLWSLDIECALSAIVSWVMPIGSGVCAREHNGHPGAIGCTQCETVQIQNSVLNVEDSAAGLCSVDGDVPSKLQVTADQRVACQAGSAGKVL